MAITRLNRVRGGLVGLLVGDALGVPYEFHPAVQIPPLTQIEFEPPAGFTRAHRGIAPGTWSDDGAQALALLASLQAHPQFDVEDFAARLLAWHRRGEYAVDGHVFDVGMQTSAALSRLAAGEPAAAAGPSGERDNGNGSLMRALPMALVWTGNDADLVAAAAAQSAVTHGHPRAQACVAFYCLWARGLLDGVAAAAAWEAAVSRFDAVAPATLRDELATHVVARVDEAPRGSGYVVDSLLAARHLLLTHETYLDVVRGAVALGEDTDTTAAIAGGLAGVRGGVDQIPQRWRDGLRGRELLGPLLAALPD